MLLLKYR